MNTVFLLGLAAGAFSTAVLGGLSWAAWKIMDQAKGWAVWADWDSGRATVSRVRARADGKFSHKVNGKEGLYIPEARARLQTDRGALYIFQEEKGWNIVGPGKAEVDNSRRLQYATLCDPFTYFRAEEHNDAQDALNANQTEKSWVSQMAGTFAIVGVVGMLGVFGLLIAIMQKVGS